MRWTKILQALRLTRRDQTRETNSPKAYVQLRDHTLPDLPHSADASVAPASSPSILVADAFLSYAHANRLIAQRLSRQLSEAGTTVFLDELSIAPSAHLQKTLELQIRSAKWYILLWSADSDRPWVMWELRLATHLAKSGLLRMVTLTLDSSALPPECSSHIHIDLSTSMWFGLQKARHYLRDSSSLVLRLTFADAVSDITYNGYELIRSRGAQVLGARNWFVALDDANLFSNLEELFSRPPAYGATQGPQSPLEVNRPSLIDDATSVLANGEVVAARIVEAYHNEWPALSIGPAVDPSRNFMSWLAHRIFYDVFCWVTIHELGGLSPRLRESIRETIELPDSLGSLPASFPKNDCFELLMGVRRKFESRTVFVHCDLIFSSGAADRIGWKAVSVWLPESNSPRAKWCEDLFDSDWPPPDYLLQPSDWMRLFVPQICRELVFAMAIGRMTADSSQLQELLVPSAYAGIGPH